VESLSFAPRANNTCSSDAPTANGAAVAAATATKQPDGTFTAARIDFGRGDVVP
jgi:hypothetical protein